MPEPQPPLRGQSTDDEYSDGDIDVRHIVQVLVNRWTLIRDLVLLVGIAAAVYSFSMPAAYEARAGVVISKARTQVSFDPKIKTLSAEDLGSAAQTDQTARRNTLAGLVKNSAIAESVLKEVGSDIPPALQSPDLLAAAVDGSISRSAGDLIEIKMTWSDGAVAERIVGSWAGNYERYVNGIYGSGYSPTVSLGKETASAKEAYDRAQTNYARFVGDNRIQALTRQVDERKKSIAILQQRVDSDRDGLFALYTTRLKLQQTLEDARTLRDQVARPGSSAGSNALAITLLKAQIVVPSASLGPSRQQAQQTQQQQPPQPSQQPPVGLTIQAAIPPTGETAAAQLADLDALVRTAEERLTQIDAAITQRSAEIQQPNPSQSGIDRLQKEQLGFDEALAKEQATLLELTRARDLAWSTYSSLASKVDERNVAQQVGGTEVVYALPARAEITTTNSKRLVTVAIAAAAAAVVALMLVGLLEIMAPEAPTPHVRWTGWLRRRDSA